MIYIGRRCRGQHRDVDGSGKEFTVVCRHNAVKDDLCQYHHDLFSGRVQCPSDFLTERGVGRR